MPGQWWLPVADPLWGIGVDDWESVVLVLVDVVGVVVVVELAALATAAPPPTSAPVTASVMKRGLIRRIVHLLSGMAPRSLRGVSTV
jgi:hypothetical protein